MPLTIFNIVLIPPQIIENKEYDKIIQLSEKEKLKLVPYGDMRLSDTGSLWYEHDLFLGFKCMIEISNTISIESEIDSKTIYRDLSENNYGFCNWKYTELKNAK